MLEGLEASRQCYLNGKTQKERDACWAGEVANGQGVFIVHLVPNFGKTHAQYFCSHQRNSFKSYIYYPGGIPRVEDGHLMGQLDYSDLYKTYVSEKSSKLVDNLDSNAKADLNFARQIDERWFIVRN